MIGRLLVVVMVISTAELSFSVKAAIPVPDSEIDKFNKGEIVQVIKYGTASYRNARVIKLIRNKNPKPLFEILKYAVKNWDGKNGDTFFKDRKHLVDVMVVVVNALARLKYYPAKRFFYRIVENYSKFSDGNFRLVFMCSRALGNLGKLEDASKILELVDRGMPEKIVRELLKSSAFISRKYRFIGKTAKLSGKALKNLKGFLKADSPKKMRKYALDIAGETASVELRGDVRALLSFVSGDEKLDVLSCLAKMGDRKAVKQICKMTIPSRGKVEWNKFLKYARQLEKFYDYGSVFRDFMVKVKNRIYSDQI